MLILIRLDACHKRVEMELPYSMMSQSYQACDAVMFLNIAFTLSDLHQHPSYLLSWK